MTKLELEQDARLKEVEQDAGKLFDSLKWATHFGRINELIELGELLVSSRAMLVKIENLNRRGF